MIKSYENFVNGTTEEVNEGFLHNVLSGIDAGIGAFKADRNAEKAADVEIKRALNGGGSEYSDEMKMTLLVKQLVERSAWLADSFSWERILETPNEAEYMENRIDKIETILSEMKELLVAHKQ